MKGKMLCFIISQKREIDFFLGNCGKHFRTVFILACSGKLNQILIGRGSNNCFRENINDQKCRKRKYRLLRSLMVRASDAWKGNQEMKLRQKVGQLTEEP